MKTLERDGKFGQSSDFSDLRENRTVFVSSISVMQFGTKGCTLLSVLVNPNQTSAPQTDPLSLHFNILLEEPCSCYLLVSPVHGMHDGLFELILLINGSV